MTDYDGNRFVKEAPPAALKTRGNDGVTAFVIALAHPCVCVRIYNYWCHAVIREREALGSMGLACDGAVSSLKAFCHRCHWLIAGLFAGKQEVRCA